MQSFDLDFIKQRLYSLNVSTPIDTNFFDTQIFDQEEINRKCVLLDLYRYLFALDALGIPIGFLMSLPDVYARLLIMLADGKFIPEIIDRLDLDVKEIGRMGYTLLELLEMQRGNLKKNEADNIELLVRDFIFTEIKLNNI